MSFCERLVCARERRGYNQKEFADLLEITPTRLNYWEKGKREPDVLMIWKIISTLNISGDWLISGVGDMERAPTIKNCENDIRKAKLIHNYESLNQAGKDKLVEYSEDLTYNPNYKLEKTHKIKIAARNGRFEERTVTDSEIEKLKNLPDMDDDI